jgi:hypothetical protein
LRQFQPAVSFFGLLTQIVFWNLDPDVFTDALVLLRTGIVKPVLQAAARRLAPDPFSKSDFL